MRACASTVYTQRFPTFDFPHDRRADLDIHVLTYLHSALDTRRRQDVGPDNPGSSIGIFRYVEADWRVAKQFDAIDGLRSY